MERQHINYEQYLCARFGCQENYELRAKFILCTGNEPIIV